MPTKAKENIEANEVKEVKPIILKDNVSGEVYVLEFDRASVKYSELKGFKINSMDDGIQLSSIEDLFHYAFRKHQPKMTKAETDKILYEKLGGMPEGMLERLGELYLAPFTALLQKEDNVKNVTMTAEF